MKSQSRSLTSSKHTLLGASALAAVLIVGSVSAHAGGHAHSHSHAGKGAYLGGAIGYSMPNDSDVDSTTDATIDIENTIGGLINFGYAYGNGLRGEIEANMRDHDADSAGSSNLTGDIEARGLFLNGLYDLDLGMPVQPYVGAGIGLLELEADTVTPVSSNILDGRERGLGLQGILGASLDLSEQLQAFADYRYVMTPEQSGFSLGTSDADMDYSSHNIMVGLRYFLSAPEKMKAEPKPQPVAAAKPTPKPAPKPAPVAKPAPKPEPAPAPIVPRNYIVFFDFDSAELTQEALLILQTAANNAPDVNYTVIELSGHADRSGASAYNQALSERRAEAVRAELVRLGVANSEIATSASGETAPLVTTEDGVRQPQNRRVEITFK